MTKNKYKSYRKRGCLKYKLITLDGKPISPLMTCKEIAKKYGLSLDSVRSLKSGRRHKIKGIYNTSKQSQKRRVRDLMILVNIQTGQQEALEGNVAAFARKHSICSRLLQKLVNDKVLYHNNWVTKKTYELYRKY